MSVKRFPLAAFLLYSSNSATWTQVPLVSTHSVVLPNASVFGLQNAIWWTCSIKASLCTCQGNPLLDLLPLLAIAWKEA